jgi:hypothetical protein
MYSIGLNLGSSVDFNYIFSLLNFTCLLLWCFAPLLACALGMAVLYMEEL